MKSVFVQTALLAAASIAHAQSPVQKAETALAALQAWYDQSSGIWNTCGWWNGANCMTVVADLAAVDSSVVATATSVFAHTFTQAPGVNPAPQLKKTNQNGFMESHYAAGWPSSQKKEVQPQDSTDANPWLDGYWDDAGWWALAWIAAYDITGNQDYLQLSQNIFSSMTTSWPTNCSNGGIYWNVQKSYINAIANELFLSVAAHLANRVPSDKAFYVGWAQDELNWFLGSGMINSKNLVNDGLTTSCANNGQTVWTYNQGVILGGLVELNKASPNSTYLSLAGTIAQAAIGALTDSNHVLHESCEPNCAPDGTQFKGIFMRNLALLDSVAPQDIYKTVATSSANSLWANDRDSSNQLSVDWSGPFANPVNASTHSCAMDALISVIQMGS